MSSRTRTAARLAAPTAALALVALSAGTAVAHVTTTPSTTAAGAYTVLTFSVGHGCEGSPTKSIVISIPEGINAATPTRNSYYDVSKQVEKLDPPVTDAHGNELTERVATVTYTAKTPLPDGYRDTFEVQVQLPEDAVGESLWFPTVQNCVKGSTPWTQIPAEGQSEDDLETPAPGFVVTEATEEGHHDGGTDEEGHEDGAEGAEGAAEETSGGTTADTEPVAASAGAADGADDDSSNGLAIGGLVAGVAGVLVGGAALARGRRTA